MTKLSIIFSLVILIIGFQNCSQKNIQKIESADLAHYGSGGGGLRANGSLEKVTLDAADALAFDSVQAPGSAEYRIDLHSGVVEIVNLDKDGQNPVTEQLTEDEKLKLNQEISGAQACIQKNEIPKGQVCTMEYTSPWLVFLGSNLEVKLGEKTNGYAIPPDMCDPEQSARLKEILRSIEQRLSK